MADALISLGLLSACGLVPQPEAVAPALLSGSDTQQAAPRVQQRPRVLGPLERWPVKHPVTGSGDNSITSAEWVPGRRVDRNPACAFWLDFERETAWHAISTLGPMGPAGALPLRHTRVRTSLSQHRGPRRPACAVQCRGPAGEDLSRCSAQKGAILRPETRCRVPRSLDRRCVHRLTARIQTRSTLDE